jgi:hypothetical protein
LVHDRSRYKSPVHFFAQANFKMGIMPFHLLRPTSII